MIHVRMLAAAVALFLLAACGGDEGPADFRVRDASWEQVGRTGDYAFDRWDLSFRLENLGGRAFAECVVEVRDRGGAILAGEVFEEIGGERTLGTSFGLPPGSRPSRPVITCEPVGNA